MENNTWKTNVAVAANELQIDFSNAFVVVRIAKYKGFIKKKHIT